MGASASTQLPPFETVEAALTAGKTQDEIDAWHASQEGGERTMITSQNGHDEFPNHFSNSEAVKRIRGAQPIGAATGGGGGEGRRGGIVVPRPCYDSPGRAPQLRVTKKILL